MSEPTRLDVNTFAQRVGRSKRQIYKHIKSGRIPAVKPHKNSSYEIDEGEVESFLEEFGPSGSQGDTAKVHASTRSDTSDTSPGSSVHDTQVHEQARPAPPAEVYGMLIDRLTRAERKAVELELTLRQHQNLLTENAESLQEDRAKVIQEQERARTAEEEKAQAIQEAEQAKQEAAKAKIELESLKTDIATKEAAWAEQRKPWWKKMWGKSG